MEKCFQVKSSARLKIEFNSVKEAEIALRSIEPDNYPLPRGLKLSMEVKDNIVHVHVECERTVSSLLATLDDILSMMNLALRSIKSISTAS